MTRIVTTIVAGAVTLLVAALVLDDGNGLGPQAVILGIAGAIIGYLAAGPHCARRD